MHFMACIESAEERLSLTKMLKHFGLTVLLVNRSSKDFDNHHARIEIEARRIYLRRGLDKKKEALAILHELGHMYLVSHGYNVRHVERFCNVFADEIYRSMGLDRFWAQPTLPRLLE